MISVNVSGETPAEIAAALGDLLGALTGGAPASQRPAGKQQPAAMSCPVHTTALKKSARGGFYCPRQQPDGTWCQATA